MFPKVNKSTKFKKNNRNYTKENSNKVNKQKKSYKEKENKGDIYMYLINIQGLTSQKMAEIEEILDENSIMILTETQLKIGKVKMNENIVVRSSMRTQDEKKGGGLMILYRRNKDLNLEKVKINNNDILYVKGELYGKLFHIIVVYFSCTYEDKAKNLILKEKIEYILNSTDDDHVIVLGDFNGHVGFKGYQKLDENGKNCTGFNGKV